MPFTLAHPAAALPLRGPLGPLAVPSALVIGSLLPDLAYFLPWPVGRAHSHSLLGLLWFCLPAGILGYGGFHVLVAPLVDALSPTALRARLPTEWSRGAVPDASAVPVVASLLAGAATHLIWDAFTHRTGFVVEALPFLSVPLATLGGYTIHGFKILQHGSSLAGMGLLAFWGRAWFRAAPVRTPPPPTPTARALLMAVLLLPPVAAGAIAGSRALLDEAGALRRLQHFLGAAIFASGSTLLVTSILAGLIWRPSSERGVRREAVAATAALYAGAFSLGSLAALAPALVDLLPPALPLAPAIAVRGLTQLSNGLPVVVDALPAALAIALLGWRTADAGRWRALVAAALLAAAFVGGRLEIEAATPRRLEQPAPVGRANAPRSSCDPVSVSIVTRARSAERSAGERHARAGASPPRAVHFPGFRASRAMGFDTIFEGRFHVAPTLSEPHRTYLRHFALMRHMRYDAAAIAHRPDPVREAVSLPVGPEGAYFTGAEPRGAGYRDSAVLDPNAPPDGQPGLWCQWVPTLDGNGLEWDGEEKFYDGPEWLRYLIARFLEPWGYTVSGLVRFSVPELDEAGSIRVLGNHVAVS